jgi:hypothetical protein
MIEHTKLSVGERAGFHPRSMQPDLPFDDGRTTKKAADKLRRGFNDRRPQGERIPPRADWLFITFWISYAAGILCIAVWALA